MIKLKSVLKIHAHSILKYGGAEGIRDLNILESAINRPFATFDGNDLYPTFVGKAAAILESILINHPFIDGNKRTAISLALFILNSNKIELVASEDNIYNFIIRIAEGKSDIDEITEWLNNNVKHDNI